MRDKSDEQDRLCGATAAAATSYVYRLHDHRYGGLAKQLREQHAVPLRLRPYPGGLTQERSCHPRVRAMLM